MPAGWLAARRGAPATPWPGHRDAAARRHADRHQPGSAPLGPGHHRPLREGGSGQAAPGCPALAGSDPVSALGEAAADYLALRRSLGHKLADAPRILPRFVAYRIHAGAQTATIAAA